jgi:hypothetical protein
VFRQSAKDRRGKHEAAGQMTCPKAGKRMAVQYCAGKQIWPGYATVNPLSRQSDEQVPPRLFEIERELMPAVSNKDVAFL